MGITGARWSVGGAEAVLKLRGCSNRDFDDSWTFHLDHERQRLDGSSYADGVIPLAAYSLLQRRTQILSPLSGVGHAC